MQEVCFSECANKHTSAHLHQQTDSMCEPGVFVSLWLWMLLMLPSFKTVNRKWPCVFLPNSALRVDTGDTPRYRSRFYSSRRKTCAHFFFINDIVLMILEKKDVITGGDDYPIILNDLNKSEQTWWCVLVKLHFLTCQTEAELYLDWIR